MWVATTNSFKTGGKDEYRLAGEFPVTAERATVDLQKMPSTFYKIIVEGKNNRMGRWVLNR